MAKAGMVKTFSIGYDVIQQEVKKGVRYLTEIKIREVSVVVGDFAADDMAVITNIKTDGDTIAEAKDCIERLQALLKAAEVKQEPPMGTPAANEDAEAALLDSALDGLIAEVEGFDAREAEARIDAILAQI